MEAEALVERLPSGRGEEDDRPLREPLDQMVHDAGSEPAALVLRQHDHIVDRRVILAVRERPAGTDQPRPIVSEAGAEAVPERPAQLLRFAPAQPGALDDRCQLGPLDGVHSFLEADRHSDSLGAKTYITSVRSTKNTPHTTGAPSCN